MRFELSYDAAAPEAPASVVGKFPSTDATSLQTAAVMRLYMRETSFYARIAPGARIRTPRVFLNHFDPATHDFCVLFEDLTPARPGDQLHRLQPDDAALPWRKSPACTPPYWASAALDAHCLGLPEAETTQIALMVPTVAGRFRDRFDSVLERDIMDAAMRLVTLARPLLFDMPPYRTVLHGDFRLDNLLFEAKGGAWRLATLDWQTVGRGCGTLDASYFLGAGLREADRARHEAELLRVYHEKLRAYGVEIMRGSNAGAIIANTA